MVARRYDTLPVADALSTDRIRAISTTQPSITRHGFVRLPKHRNCPLPIPICTRYHIDMASKTTINFDDEMEAALEELAALDGTKTLAIKRSLLAEVKRRRRSQALVDLISSWEADEGAIDQAHLDWADAVLDRQGVV